MSDLAIAVFVRHDTTWQQRWGGVSAHSVAGRLPIARASLSGITYHSVLGLRCCIMTIADAMKRVKLGSSDVEVSIVCLVRLLWYICAHADHAADDWLHIGGAAFLLPPCKAAAVKALSRGGGQLVMLTLCCPDLPQGTMTWGCQNTEEEAFEQLDYALSKGVNFIDTGQRHSRCLSLPLHHTHQVSESCPSRCCVCVCVCSGAVSRAAHR